VEALLRKIGEEAAEDGAELCALCFDVDSDGRPVQAIVTVTLRSVDGSTDPAAILELIEEAEGGEVDADVIRTGSGTGLKITAQTEDGLLDLKALIPMPEVPGRVALISLVSPSLTHEDKVRGFFDALVGTFAFTWEDDSE
jgi:hypothetical protein